MTTLPFTRGIEDWMLDGQFFYRGTRPTDARVVIIGLDEPYLKNLKKPLTHLSPELARVVRHTLGQGATAVGLDVMVAADRSRDPEIARIDGSGEGWTLGQVVVQSGGVVLPVRNGGGEPLLPLEPWWQPKRLLRPERTDFGFVDLDEDGDQFVRRQGLLLGQTDPVPHFALALYARSRGESVERDPVSGSISVGSRPIPVDAEGRMRINFVGPPGVFPVVPFGDALAAADAGAPFSAQVRGAVVIIGVTARTMQDYHATPFANNYARYEAAPAPGRMSGPELQAHLLATLHDRAFVTTPWWLTLIPLLVASGLLLGIAYTRLSLEAGFLLAVVHHFAWKGFAVAMFSGLNYRVELTAVLVLGAVAYMLVFAVRWRVLRRMFGVVKSEAVARALEADPDRLNPGGETRDVTVLFADIRDFTPFSDPEKHTASDVVTLLNAYFAAVVPAIEAEGGTVVSYLGDGIMALFGAPANQPDHARRAVRAAGAMLREVHARRVGWEKLDRAGVWAERGGLRVGIGVHTGRVVVGAVGAPGRLDYTAIGDVVNVASRMEGATKELKVEAVVSADTVRALDLTAADRTGLGLTTPPVSVRVKGVDEPVRLYPLMVGGQDRRPGPGGIG
jgi:adenylate cyclase